MLVGFSNKPVNKICLKLNDCKKNQLAVKKNMLKSTNPYIFWGTFDFEVDGRDKEKPQVRLWSVKIVKCRIKETLTKKVNKKTGKEKNKKIQVVDFANPIEEKFYQEFGDVHSFISYLKTNYWGKKEEIILYAQNGSSYELTFIYPVLKELGEKFVIPYEREDLESLQTNHKSFDKNYFEHSVNLIKRIYSLKWGNFSFLCSWLLTRMSLASLLPEKRLKIKALGEKINWEKLNFDQLLKRGYSGVKENKITQEELKKYNENDTVGLLETLREIFCSFPLAWKKLTLASWALAEMMESQPEMKWIPHFLNDNNSRFYNMAKEASFGTIVNFWNKRVTVAEFITSIDVNSMYPTMMKYFAVPWGKPTIFINRIPKKNPNNYNFKLLSEVPENFFGFVKVRLKNVRYVGNHYPYVVNRIYNPHSVNKEIKGGYYCPIKLTDGIYYWTSAWYQKIRKNYKGTFTIKEIHRYPRVYGFFEDFLDKWTKIKEIHKKGSSLHILAKNVLNSLYGKFGQNKNWAKKKSWTFNYQPILATVLTNARIYLLETIEKFPREYWRYSDTDSMFLALPLKEIKKTDILLDDTKLGYWKAKEYKNSVMTVIAPKFFKIEPQNEDNPEFETIFKGRGVNKEILKHVSDEQWAQLLKKGILEIDDKQSKVTVSGRSIFTSKKNVFINDYRKNCVMNDFLEWED